MVTFVCEGCNETLKKAVVARHACVARGAGATCVDCSRTFYGAEHAAHTSCVSEAEKHQKGLYRGGAADEKRAKHDPQAAWTALIARAAAQQAPGSRLALVLQQLTGYSNVPRKLKPFINFARNSLRQHNDALLTEVFNAVAALLPPRPAPQAAGAAAAAAAGAAAEEGEEAEAEAEPTAAAEAEAPKQARKRQRAEAAEAEAEAEAAAAAAAGAVPSEDAEGAKRARKAEKKAAAAEAAAAAAEEAAVAARAVADAADAEARAARAAAVAARAQAGADAKLLRKAERAAAAAQ